VLSSLVRPVNGYHLDCESQIGGGTTLRFLRLNDSAVALDSGCNFYRGQESDSQRECAIDHGWPAAFRPFAAQAGHFIAQNKPQAKKTARHTQHRYPGSYFIRQLATFQMRWPWGDVWLADGSLSKHWRKTLRISQRPGDGCKTVPEWRAGSRSSPIASLQIPETLDLLVDAGQAT